MMMLGSSVMGECQAKVWIFVLCCQCLVLLSDATFFRSRNLYDSSLTQSEYTCGDSRWKLQTNDSNWNFNVSLWTLTNVFVRPGTIGPEYCATCYQRRIFPWFFINASVVVKESETNVSGFLDNMYTSAMECTKDIQWKSNPPREPVFFNFPCVNSKGFRWVSDNRDLYSPPSSMNWYYKELPDRPFVYRDLLIVFNSWGVNSIYHNIIETIFPLWVTVEKAKKDMKYPMNNMTIMNLSPRCDDEQHLLYVKPIIDTLFGNFVYEDTWGIISGSFDHSFAALYKNMIYGFHHSMRPYRNHVLMFNAELGSYLRNFSMVMKSHYANPPTNQWDSINNNNLTSIITILRTETYGKRFFHQESYLPGLFESRGMKYTNISFGSGNLGSLQEQAKFSSTVDILLGAEGAGFVQQIFMPVNSLLILLHAPREFPKNKYGQIEGSQWHEAVAQYLDHSVMNIVTPGLQELTYENNARIVNVSMMAIAMHRRLRQERKYFSCTVKNVDEPWTEADGCQTYIERPFLL